jgi:hypothetical protein
MFAIDLSTAAARIAPGKPFRMHCATPTLGCLALREVNLPLQNIQLRKLLMLGFAPARLRKAELRVDIRTERMKLAGLDTSGPDFYGAFWADAKAHVFGEGDLSEATDRRIVDNWRRKNLYPRLRDGFLTWWNARRRLTNAPVHVGQIPKARFAVSGLAATVKVDNILSVTDGEGTCRYVYPYFAPEPELDEAGARMGLWLLGQALPEIPIDQMRILDVIRGRTFSVGRTPLLGNEELDFLRMYELLIRERDVLRET